MNLGKEPTNMVTADLDARERSVDDLNITARSPEGDQGSLFSSVKSNAQGLYEPLDPASDRIRLLRVVGGICHGPKIKYRIKTFSLANCPAYVALSYVWGKPPSGKTVSVNGFSVPVGDNLHDALDYLGRDMAEVDPYQPYLWCDALCINQSDQSERGHQVRLMGSIYSSADCVSAWMGPTTHIPNYGTEAPFEIYFEEIAENQYWNRMWTIQEFLLAKKVLLKSGYYETDVDMNLHDDKFMQRFGRRYSRAWTILQERRHRSKCLSDQRLHTSALPFIFMLKVFEYREATDPRDKVYALLGLLNENEAGLIVPDYTLTTAQVYEMVIGALSIPQGSRGVLRKALQLEEKDVDV